MGRGKGVRDNTMASTKKFLYKNIWCHLGCPVKLISDQGGHIIDKVVHRLIEHYAVVHKKSTPYYP